MLITDGALTWPLVPPGQPANPSGATTQQWAEAQSCAIEWLWAVSGRRYGTRQAVLRPQGSLSGSCYQALPYLQSIYGPLWGSDELWASNRTAERVLELPGPAQSIVSVQLVDGSGTSSVLDPSAYRLDGNYLVRIDGQTWPTTQDLISNLGSANTWAVTYQRGVPVPMGGQIAAAFLAAEWLNLICGVKDACKLPWNTVTASRSGVTVQLQASLAYRTSGIPAVDRWVTSVNPNALAQPPRVWSPDVARNSQPYRGSDLAYRPTA